MAYPVYLRLGVHGRGAYAHVPDLPGCSLRGESKNDVLARLPAAISDYLAWLAAHGEPLPPAGEVTAFEVAGEAENTAPLSSCHQTGFFPQDVLPLSDEDIARYLRLMHYARDDLVSIAGGLSYAVLRWRPAQKGWAVRDILRHVTGLERWYLDRLGIAEPLPRTHTISEYMALTRACAYDALRSLTAEQRAAVVNTGGEEWTARKVLRRFIEHEREHTAQICNILAQYNVVHAGSVISGFPDLTS